MFRGNFAIEKNESGELVGQFSAETPRGPFVMHLVCTPSESGEKRAAQQIMGELLDGASYFTLGQLIGKGPTAYAKKLYAAMKSKNPVEQIAAKEEYQRIAERARAGKERAQDIIYAISRLQGQEMMGADYKPGRIRNPRSLAIFDPTEMMGGVVKAAKKGELAACIGIDLYREYSRGDKKKARKIHQLLGELADRGHEPAEDTLAYFGRVVAAEKERRRQEKVACVQGAGFDFGNFMKDVGKVAGPVMSALAPVAKFVPFVGPILEPAMNLASSAIANDQQAVKKVERINTLADAGVPKAIRAKTALKVATKIKRAKAITDAIKTGALRPDPKGPRTRKERFIKKTLSLFPKAVKEYNLTVIEQRKKAKDSK